MRSNRHQSQSHRRNKSSRRSAPLPELVALESRRLMSAVPALSSRPGAAQKLYIDFDGDTTANWGSYHPNTTPAYDTDGNPSSFSSGELSNIQQIWARVAEKYSPFNIDVTTIDPGSYGDRSVMRIVVGGNGGWAGGGGITYVGSYTNSGPNTGYVFSSALANGDPHYVAEAVAHEAGHGFGLSHQSSYSGSSLTAVYNMGNSATAPIMGNSYYASRGLWWSGQTEAGASSYQDDLSVLGNTIGYRADDYGNSIYAASPLSGSSFSVNGVIEKTSDTDDFSFYTSGGSANITVNPSSYGGMLDAKLSILNSSGNVVATSDSGLSESISTSLSAGTYYVVVGSHGSYGDVGQYSLTGSIGGGGNTYTPPPTTNTGGGTYNGGAPAAPSNLYASSPSSSQVSLSWSDNSSNETGFKVQRTADGSNWTTVATVNAGVTAYVDGGLNANTNYAYRVLATNSSGDSSSSNAMWVTTRASGTPVTTTTNPPPTTSTNTGNNTGTKVTGTPIATAGSWANSGNDYSKAIDGNINTYFDAPSGDYDYVGYDLGAGNAKVISSVRYAPRSGQSARMVGGQFQGSNDGVTWSTFYTVSSQPADGQYTSATVNSGTAFRYVRYLSPNGGFGNVAEVEFYTNGGGTTTTTNNNTGTTTGSLTAPSNLTATSTSSSTVNLSWSDNSYNENGFKIERTTDGAHWTTVATVGAGVTSYTDAGLAAYSNYAYRVRATNSSGDSGSSNAVWVTTRSAAWAQPVDAAQPPDADVTPNFSLTPITYDNAPSVL